LLKGGKDFRESIFLSQDKSLEPTAQESMGAMGDREGERPPSLAIILN